MDVILSHDAANLARLRYPPRLNRSSNAPLRASGLRLCDCTSIFYFVLSTFLVGLGSFITITALGGPHHALFSNLGHMWSVGPICVCCGIVTAIKSLLYLRRKIELQMLLPTSMSVQVPFQVEGQGRFLEGYQPNTASLQFQNADDYMIWSPGLIEQIILNQQSLQSNSGGVSPGCIVAAALSEPVRSRPPAYESVMQHSVEDPPPSYEEAIALISQHKSSSITSAQSCELTASVA